MELIIRQLLYLLASFLWGMLLMLVYDVLRIFRGIKKHKKGAVVVGDLLFWCISAVFVFHMVFVRNQGIVRSFFVVSLLFAMWLYRQTVGDSIVNQVLKVVWRVKRLIFKCGKKLTNQRKSP